MRKRIELVLRVLQLGLVAGSPVALGDETRLHPFRLVAQDAVSGHVGLDGIPIDRGVALTELGNGSVLGLGQDAAQPLADRRGEMLELISHAGEQIRLQLARCSLHLRDHGVPVNRCSKGGGPGWPARFTV